MTAYVCWLFPSRHITPNPTSRQSFSSQLSALRPFSSALAEAGEDARARPVSRAKGGVGQVPRAAGVGGRPLPAGLSPLAQAHYLSPLVPGIRTLRPA